MLTMTASSSALLLGPRSKQEDGHEIDTTTILRTPVTNSVVAKSRISSKIQRSLLYNLFHLAVGCVLRSGMGLP